MMWLCAHCLMLSMYCSKRKMILEKLCQLLCPQIFGLVYPKQHMKSDQRTSLEQYPWKFRFCQTWRVDMNQSRILQSIWKTQLASSTPFMPLAFGDLNSCQDFFSKNKFGILAKSIQSPSPTPLVHWKNLFIKVHQVGNRSLTVEANLTSRLPVPLVSHCALYPKLATCISLLLLTILSVMKKLITNSSNCFVITLSPKQSE